MSTFPIHPLRLLSYTTRIYLTLHLIYTHLYTQALTHGASMLPTFSVYGDSALISRYYRRGRDIHVGDMVTFDSVVKPGEKVIKRVLGMPGDYVLRDTPRRDGGCGGMMMQVPQGHCWVVGDNMPYSRDSRHFGPMPLALIKGKVLSKFQSWYDPRWVEDGLKPPELD
ncbi:signal peptidase-like protein I [Amylocarpus encephaloides]|uniref:Signal peptidase-like protein I n=1 Tax=Amylocarpus encephaloides TaxID=45428 RepID=A0A9P8C295_9HELO|nr:signal peptidase-like protein I [Amylocarpus encephaloides]